MAFGISGAYQDPATGQEVPFEGPWDGWEKTVAAFPNGSITRIQLYNHGAPGWIGDSNAETLAEQLGPKMAPAGAIDITGCNTAGFIPDPTNPLGGANSLVAMIFYNGAPKLAGDSDMAELGWQNLASDLSTRLPGVYVGGISGFGLPFSRLWEWTGLGGYEPSAVAEARRVYLNGEQLPIRRPIIDLFTGGQSRRTAAEYAAQAAESKAKSSATDGAGTQDKLSSDSCFAILRASSSRRRRTVWERWRPNLAGSEIGYAAKGV